MLLLKQLFGKERLLRNFEWKSGVHSSASKVVTFKLGRPPFTTDKTTSLGADGTRPGRPASRQRILLTLILWLGTAAVLAAEELAAQRAAFQVVLNLQSQGQHEKAREAIRGLENYPLFPYYLYNDLRRRLNQLPHAEVQKFLRDYEQFPLEERMRAAWLKVLRRKQRWQSFIDFYQPSGSTSVRCDFLRARIETGDERAVLSETRSVWLDGSSLPDTCDFAFERLYASPLMTDALLLQRIGLAFDKNNTRLAGYLGKRLQTADSRQRFDAWQDAHSTPLRVLQQQQVEDDETHRALARHALLRLSRRDPELSAEVWLQASAHYRFSEEDRGIALRTIALGLAGAKAPGAVRALDAVPESHADGRIQALRLRAGIENRAWPYLARWTAGPSPTSVYALRWRYWRARALEEIGQTSAANALLHELAQERDYYGFLAADRLGVGYRFNNRTVGATEEELAELASRAALVRARELLLLEQPEDARREWFHELRQLDKRQLEIAARLAASWEQPSDAILALGRAQSYDDLELRFPLLYHEEISLQATRRDLDPARVLAIVRSESAFNARARSHAGALGLMQLMPATARQTATRIGLPLTHTEYLYRPRENIALGTAYLSTLLKKYDGNFVLTSAAYNAGPSRVNSWLPPVCTPAEFWIEQIPFTETRRYVRRALFYTAIYQQRLGATVEPLSSVMPQILTNLSAEEASCNS